MLNKKGLVCLFLWLAAIAPAHSAGDCTWSSVSPTGCPFTVQATIQNGCLISGGVTQFGVLDFGIFSSLSSETATAALANSIVLTCTPDMTVTMKVNAGQHFALGARQVQRSGGYTLAYRIYSDSARQNPIGVNQSLPIVIDHNGSTVVLPIYGELILPGGSPPGAYLDTLSVELSW